jgi:hypothetical protein
MFGTAKGRPLSACKDCTRAANRKSYRRHWEKRQLKRAEYKAANKEKYDAAIKAWATRKRDEGYFRTQEKRDKRRAYYKRIKQLVFETYGGAFCRCCGESEISFLSLDHIAGDGASHRRMLNKQSSQNMYMWIKSQGFPPGFQVLCASCNLGKFLNNNVCPHELARQELTALAEVPSAHQAP